MTTLAVFAASFSLTSHLLAEEVTPAPPQIRASIDSNGDTLVGQKITLVIELLAPGIFADSPMFDIPQVPGVLILPPSGSPTITNEDHNGVSFTVQRHELLVFARKAGVHEISPFHVRFSFKPSPLDKSATSADVTTPGITFATKMPPGAEGLNAIVCAKNLEVRESWQPSFADAKVGDAFTRTIEYSAQDIPGMAFPPFPAIPVDGLRLYSAAPQVNDEVNRGELTGKRRDSITYVCERPGHFVVPAVQLTWWNLDEHKLKTITFSERAISVAANPALPTQMAESADSTAVNLPRFAVVIGASIAAVLAIVWLARHKDILKPIAQYLMPVRLAELNPTNACKLSRSSSGPAEIPRFGPI